LKKILSIVLFIVVLSGCINNEYLLNKELQESISTVVSDTNNTEIDISKLTDFDWEEAYLFAPYTSQDDINRELGFKSKDKSDIHIREDIYLLLFVNENKVVHYVEIERQKSDFLITDGSEKITPENPMITIKRINE
jgi:hypothetical protein